MGLKRTGEFRQDAVRIALTSGLTRKQVADDLGVGMSTLNKWITAHRDTEVVSNEDIDLAKENDRLRREIRFLKEEREVLKKTVPGWGPPVRGRNSLCYRCDMKGSGRSLIGGPGIVRNPVKKRGPWVDANLGMVTLLWQ